MAQRRSKGTLDGKIAGLYDLDKTIGKGHFAVVKLARHVFTGERVAVKVIDKTKLDEVSKAHLFQEVRCMKLVQHPNVVRLYEVIDTQTKLYLILELGDGGDLYDYIMKHEKGLGEDSARKYFRQIVEAISYCHKLHVVHRDLKPENVVFFEKQGIVKLTDFGFSNMFNPSEKLETACGSLAYSAPEILLGDSYDPPAVDVWSLGVILFMLCCGQPPFQEANDSETLTMILDCKYKMPLHVSKECTDLVNIMLKREPSERASLEEILCHEWLQMDMEAMPPPSLPLISREHLSDEDHNYLVDKMVEGEIGSREEILKSIEKDEYNHITATYYLLAERKLKQLRQELQNSALSQIRKHSAPPGAKPHLEPLALSPRVDEPENRLMNCLLSPSLEIPVSPPPSESPNYFVKSLSGSMTLDRKGSKRKNKLLKPQGSGSSGNRSQRSPSPRSLFRNFQPTLGTIHDAGLSQSEESLLTKSASKGNQPLSKIQILKQFFERKVAALVGKQSIAEKRTNLFKQATSSKKQNSDIQTKDNEQKEDQWKPKISIVESLVSPPGTHPSPAQSTSLSPDRDRLLPRKYSLIQEESEDYDDDDMEVEESDIRHARSAENLLDDSVPDPMTSLTNDNMNLKRPLISVASSPQLLKQICEENESDEEDDFVPTKIHSPRLTKNRSRCSSPEIIRKYEQRRRKGTGSRGQSCSSSDASDTDDTEGRSRKDKLKHKFMHRRRDSSDHSSDTDGGPSGPGGGNNGGGRGFEGGSGRPPKERKDKDRKDDGSSGKGHSSKEGKGGGKGRQQHNVVNNDSNGKLLNGQASELSISSAISNLSVGSKNSLKYIVEKNESDIEDSSNDYCSYSGSSRQSSQTHLFTDSNLFLPVTDSNHQRDFFRLADKENMSQANTLLSSSFASPKTKSRKLSNMKVDINRNGYCHVHHAHQVPVVKAETKCCSVV